MMTFVEKSSIDYFTAVICNAQWIRDQGVEIPEKPSMTEFEPKPEKKKKQC